MLNEEFRFRLAINAAPFGDVDLRLRFADWLDDQGRYDEATKQREWVESFQWMCEFIMTHYESAVYYDGINQRLWDRFFEFLDAHRPENEPFLSDDIPYRFTAYSDELWMHYERLTGCPSPAGPTRYQRPEDLSCAC